MKVEELDLANALREERKSAELQHLDKDFYQQVGVYLAGLGQELSQVEDPFSVEAQILQDTLKSEKNSVNKLIDQRVKKIVRRALRNARSASREEVLPGHDRGGGGDLPADALCHCLRTRGHLGPCGSHRKAFNGQERYISGIRNCAVAG